MKKRILSILLDAAADNSIGGGRTDEYHTKVRREH